jgi:hypothetical protein
MDERSVDHGKLIVGSVRSVGNFPAKTIPRER